jgi:formamidopyrimidine-DNA glycosylase
MPELPDVELYVEALRERIVGHQLRRVEIRGPFLLRTFDPPLAAAEGKGAREVRRIGKRIALGFENEIWLALHLMIAGRLHWRAASPKPAGKNALAAFEFECGTLSLTEAGTQHRASLHVLAGEAGLLALDAGGIDPIHCSLADFAARLTAANHTLKRALTAPALFSGIGNAYSDEILHRARLSPIALTSRLSAEEIEGLRAATRETLTGWTTRLRQEAAGKVPEKVTAFRPEMAAHGRYGLPCPRCGAKIQRIRYASNETNYCPTCQTGGRLLADRALSRLLREDWPRTPEELENRMRAAPAQSQIRRPHNPIARGRGTA